MGRARRKPERWDGLDPWLALATAMTLQAHQDVAEGARCAKVILEGKGGNVERGARQRFQSCGAMSAATFFLSSPIWHYFQANLNREMADDLVSNVQDVLEANRILAEWEDAAC